MKSRLPFTLKAPRPIHVVGVFLVLTLSLVANHSLFALLTAALDLLGSLIILAPAIGLGLCLVPLLGLNKVPLRWHFLLASALGIGCLSLLVLLGGVPGLLGRTLWEGLLILGTVVGVVRLKAHRGRGIQSEKVGGTGINGGSDSIGWLRWLWLLLIPSAAMALLAAVSAPGMIRREEGFGYDVLEYHLQMPKEYYRAGHISYAPHNVYANFPANVEMLYLLTMIIRADVLDVGTTCNMIHLLLGALTVYAAWVIGSEWSPRAGLISALTMGSCGWLIYLAGLAYVEHGMLFFGTAALGIVIRLNRVGRTVYPPKQSRDRKRAVENEPRALASADDRTQIEPAENNNVILPALLAGLLAGLSCGCKYTALPLVAIPIGLVLLIVSSQSLKHRLLQLILFFAATLIAFSPWLIKNLAYTGNPVFPLAHRWFTTTPQGFGEEQAERWQKGHETPLRYADGINPLRAFWQRVSWDRYQRFGPLLLILPFVSLVGRRLSRVDLSLWLIVVVQALIWCLATHLFARFAVVLLIPLSLLAGRAMLAGEVGPREANSPKDHVPLPRGWSRAWRGTVLIMAIAGVGWNTTFAFRLHQQEDGLAFPASPIYDGELTDYAYFKEVNHEWPPSAHLLLIGDAKAFYYRPKTDYFVIFNENPFVEAIRSANQDSEIIDWLRQQGYTHVLVHWSEVRRLASTYGFAREITPELFERLERVGLRLTHDFDHLSVRGKFVQLYEVLPE